MSLIDLRGPPPNPPKLACPSGHAKTRAGVHYVRNRSNCGHPVVWAYLGRKLCNKQREAQSRMASENDLHALLAGMNPEMQPGIFVFCTISEESEIPAVIRPLLTFREHEGTTLVVRREEAE